LKIRKKYRDRIKLVTKKKIRQLEAKCKTDIKFYKGTTCSFELGSIPVGIAFFVYMVENINVYFERTRMISFKRIYFSAEGSAFSSYVVELDKMTLHNMEKLGEFYAKRLQEMSNEERATYLCRQVNEFFANEDYWEKTKKKKGVKK